MGNVKGGKMGPIIGMLSTGHEMDLPTAKIMNKELKKMYNEWRDNFISRHGRPPNKQQRPADIVHVVELSRQVILA